MVRELAPAVAGKKMNNKKKNKIRQTFEIMIGEDDTRDAVRASGWSLIFVGAIAAAVAVFFPQAVPTTNDPHLAFGPGGGLSSFFVSWT